MKQETIEESAERWVFDTNGHKWSNNDDTAGDNYGSFITGAKWQQERSYSEEEVRQLFQKYISTQIPLSRLRVILHKDFKDWFEQFKKK